jgi:glutaredoxin
MAKDLIKDYVEDQFDDMVEVINNPSKEIVDELKEQTGHTTYPFIFFDGEFIGGFTELQRPKNTVKILATLHSKYGLDNEF